MHACMGAYNGGGEWEWVHLKTFLKEITMLLSTLMNSSFPLFWVDLIWVTLVCCWCYCNLVILLEFLLTIRCSSYSWGTYHKWGRQRNKCRFDTDGCDSILCWWCVGHNLFKKSASIDLTAMKNDPGPWGKVISETRAWSTALTVIYDGV